MINRVKVSDGDLIVAVAGGGSWSDKSRKELFNKLTEWTKSRGLSNVEVVIVPPGKSEETQFNVFSVNDVFQDLVLDERNEQKEKT